MLDLQGYHVSSKKYKGIIRSHVSVLNTMLKVSVVTVFIVSSAVTNLWAP